jgi:predicted metal-dependent phosphoesterase TrpH
VNIDLHSHSRASDGLLSPAALVGLAAARGVDVLALTDHDDLSGLEEASRAADDHGIRLINGVEISSVWRDDLSVHVVGLGVCTDDAELCGGLESIRHSRAARAERMADSLAKAGIPGALEGALTYAGNASLLSRTHFARFLSDNGYARDTRSVFNHYLVPGKPGYVEHQWALLEDAVRWIRSSGGSAVLAHPGRYGLPRATMRELLGEFRDVGGEAVEVLSGSHSPEQFREFAMLAKEFGLTASRGSDFHGPGESRTELGALPLMPPGVTPVWQSW